MVRLGAGFHGIQSITPPISICGRYQTNTSTARPCARPAAAVPSVGCDSTLTTEILAPRALFLCSGAPGCCCADVPTKPPDNTSPSPLSISFKYGIASCSSRRASGWSLLNSTKASFPCTEILTSTDPPPNASSCSSAIQRELSSACNPRSWLVLPIEHPC